MKKLLTKLITTLIAALLFFTVAIGTGEQVYAADPVSYLYPVYNTDGVPSSGIKEWKQGTITEYRYLGDSHTLTSGWYVLPEYTDSGILLNDMGILTVSGDVHIILCDNSNKYTYTDGFNVTGDSSLTIYGQTKGNGIIKCKSYDKYQAAIGGLDHQDGCNITINGGTITAQGGDFAAGIGGGTHCNGNNITINGGTVTATGGDRGAGIGGGSGGAGNNITINGGTVTATGGPTGAGIGGGYMNAASNIAINGGTITVNGGADTVAIGGSYSYGNLKSTNITISTNTLICADNNNPPTTVLSNNGGDLSQALEDKQYVSISPIYMTGTSLPAGSVASPGETDSNIRVGDIGTDSNRIKSPEAATALSTSGTTEADSTLLIILAIILIIGAIVSIYFARRKQE